jgi:hypothetical protein
VQTLVVVLRIVLRESGPWMMLRLVGHSSGDFQQQVFGPYLQLEL